MSNQRKAVSDPVQGLNMMGNEAANIFSIIELDLHQKIILTRYRMHFGNSIHLLDGGISYIIGSSKLTFQKNEQSLHQPSFAFR